MSWGANARFWIVSDLISPALFGAKLRLLGSLTGSRFGTTVHRLDRYSIGLERMARPVQIAQF
jgi:hypothetical protein